MGVATLGERISEARKDLGMTQEELAELIGMSRSYLADIESNAKNISKVYQLEALSNALHLTPTYILTGHRDESWQAGQELGLSGLACEQLRLYKEHNQTHAANVVNVTLENSFLLESLYEYLFNDLSQVITEDEKTHEIYRVPASSFALEHALFNSMRIDSFEPLVRLSVMDMLKRVREEIKNGKS